MERKSVYTKFIWKVKVNDRLNESRNDKRIQEFTILVGKLYIKLTLKKKRMRYLLIITISLLPIQHLPLSIYDTNILPRYFIKNSPSLSFYLFLNPSEMTKYVK
jgi:hypothetical protein